MKANAIHLLLVALIVVTQFGTGGCTLIGAVVGSKYGNLPPTCSQLSESVDKELSVRLKTGDRIRGVLLPASDVISANDESIASAYPGVAVIQPRCTLLHLRTKSGVRSIPIHDVKSISLTKARDNAPVIGALIGLGLDALSYFVVWKNIYAGGRGFNMGNF